MRTNSNELSVIRRGFRILFLGCDLAMVVILLYIRSLLLKDPQMHADYAGLHIMNIVVWLIIRIIIEVMLYLLGKKEASRKAQNGGHVELP